MKSKEHNSVGMILLNALVCALFSGGCASAADINEFSSDGCTLFLNGTPDDRMLWCDCCFNHDIAYWRGGSEEERKEADKMLQACALERTGSKALADTMYEGVRFGGSAVFPTWYRWGYGWKYGRGYKPLTEIEQKQVAAKLEKYKKANPGGFCHKQ